MGETHKGGAVGVAYPRFSIGGTACLPFLALGLSLAACGGTATPMTTTRVPDTAADPAPYVPPAADNPEAGAVVSARVATHMERAEEIGLRFLQALACGSGAEAEAMISPEFVFLGRRTRQQGLSMRSRFQSAVSRTQPQPLEALVDLSSFTFERVMDASDGSIQSRLSTMRPTDVVVRFELTEQGARAFRRLPLFRSGGMLVIREEDGFIVGS